MSVIRPEREVMMAPGRIQRNPLTLLSFLQITFHAVDILNTWETHVGEDVF